VYRAVIGPGSGDDGFQILGFWGRSLWLAGQFDDFVITGHVRAEIGGGTGKLSYQTSIYTFETQLTLNHTT